MAQIFVSYSRSDIIRVEPLVRLLENNGWSVWWDTSLAGGEHWPKVIKREIGLASTVVVVWSRHSIESEWVYSEASAGKSRGILVPVLIDSVEPPMPFEQIQATDLSLWSPPVETAKTKQFISAVHRALGDATKPALPGEQLRWDAIKNRTKADDYTAFLKAFPNGRYADTASVRAQQLNLGGVKSAATPAPAPKPAPLMAVIIGLIALALGAYWYMQPRQLVVENTLADAGRVWEHIRETKDVRILEAYEHDFAAFPTYVALAKEKRSALQPEPAASSASTAASTPPPPAPGTGATLSKDFTVPWTFTEGALCPLYAAKSDCEKDPECLWAYDLFTPQIGEQIKQSCRKRDFAGSRLCTGVTKYLCEQQGCTWDDNALVRCKSKSLDGQASQSPGGLTGIVKPYGLPARNCISHISMASCLVAGCKWSQSEGGTGIGVCTQPPADRP